MQQKEIIIMNTELAQSALFEDANGAREISPFSVLFSEGELFLAGEITTEVAIRFVAMTALQESEKRE